MNKEELCKLREEVKESVREYTKKLSEKLEGKKIVEVRAGNFECFDGSFVLVLEDGMEISLCAEGDDMAHLVCEITRNGLKKTLQ